MSISTPPPSPKSYCPAPYQQNHPFKNAFPGASGSPSGDFWPEFLPVNKKESYEPPPPNFGRLRNSGQLIDKYLATDRF